MRGLSKEEFLDNKEKQYAVLRALEIIGEATKKLSDEMKAEYPEIQWSDIAGMRGQANSSILWRKPRLSLGNRKEEPS